MSQIILQTEDGEYVPMKESPFYQSLYLFSLPQLIQREPQENLILRFDDFPLKIVKALFENYHDPLSELSSLNSQEGKNDFLKARQLASRLNDQHLISYFNQFDESIQEESYFRQLPLLRWPFHRIDLDRQLLRWFESSSTARDELRKPLSFFPTLLRKNSIFITLWFNSSEVKEVKQPSPYFEDDLLKLPLKEEIKREMKEKPYEAKYEDHPFFLTFLAGARLLWSTGLEVNYICLDDETRHFFISRRGNNALSFQLSPEGLEEKNYNEVGQLYFRSFDNYLTLTRKEEEYDEDTGEIITSKTLDQNGQTIRFYEASTYSWTPRFEERRESLLDQIPLLNILLSASQKSHPELVKKIRYQKIYENDSPSIINERTYLPREGQEDLLISLNNPEVTYYAYPATMLLHLNIFHLNYQERNRVQVYQGGRTFQPLLSKDGLNFLYDIREEVNLLLTFNPQNQLVSEKIYLDSKRKEWKEKVYLPEKQLNYHLIVNGENLFLSFSRDLFSLRIEKDELTLRYDFSEKKVWAKMTSLSFLSQTSLVETKEQVDFESSESRLSEDQSRIWIPVSFRGQRYELIYNKDSLSLEGIFKSNENKFLEI